jgi:opacity protein-like surface antigen
MKIIICLLVLFFSFLKTEATAQNSFIFGFKAGQSFSKMEGNDVKQTLPFVERQVTPTGKDGFTGGISFGYRFLNIFTVMAEAMYVQKGAVYSDRFSVLSALPFPLPPGVLIPSGSDTVNFTADFTGEYIEVPLLFAMTPDWDFALKPSFFTGPNFGFLTGQRKDVRYEGAVLDNPLRVPLPPPFDTITVNPRPMLPEATFAFKDFDMGWTFGGGLEYELLKSASLVIEARYTMGFNSAVDSVGFGPTSITISPFGTFPLNEGTMQRNPDIKNRSLAILAMLKYRF